MLDFDRILEVADPAVPLPIAITRRLGAFWATDLPRARLDRGFLGFRRRRLRWRSFGLFSHGEKVGALQAADKVDQAGRRLEKQRGFTI